MKENRYLGGDVLADLAETVPDTSETRRAAREDVFRIALADAMRRVRARVGITQKDLATRLDVGQSWISKLESSNNDHTFESVLTYLDGLGADLKASILLDGRTVAEVTADPEALLPEEYTPATEEAIITPSVEIPAEQKEAITRAQAVIRSIGFWAENAA